MNGHAPSVNDKANIDATHPEQQVPILQQLQTISNALVLPRFEDYMWRIFAPNNSINDLTAWYVRVIKQQHPATIQFVTAVRTVYQQTLERNHVADVNDVNERCRYLQIPGNQPPMLLSLHSALAYVCGEHQLAATAHQQPLPAYLPLPVPIQQQQPSDMPGASPAVQWWMHALNTLQHTLHERDAQLITTQQLLSVALRENELLRHQLSTVGKILNGEAPEAVPITGSAPAQASTEAASTVAEQPPRPAEDEIDEEIMAEFQASLKIQEDEVRAMLAADKAASNTAAAEPSAPWSASEHPVPHGIYTSPEHDANAQPADALSPPVASTPAAASSPPTSTSTPISGRKFAVRAKRKASNQLDGAAGGNDEQKNNSNNNSIQTTADNTSTSTSQSTTPSSSDGKSQPSQQQSPMFRVECEYTRVPKGSATKTERPITVTFQREGSSNKSPSNKHPTTLDEWIDHLSAMTIDEARAVLSSEMERCLSESNKVTKLLSTGTLPPKLMTDLLERGDKLKHENKIFQQLLTDNKLPFFSSSNRQPYNRNTLHSRNNSLNSSAHADNDNDSQHAGSLDDEEYDDHDDLDSGVYSEGESDEDDAKPAAKRQSIASTTPGNETSIQRKPIVTARRHSKDIATPAQPIHTAHGTIVNGVLKVSPESAKLLEAEMRAVLSRLPQELREKTKVQLQTHIQHGNKQQPLPDISTQPRTTSTLAGRVPNPVASVEEAKDDDEPEAEAVKSESDVDDVDEVDDDKSETSTSAPAAKAMTKAQRKKAKAKAKKAAKLTQGSTAPHSNDTTASDASTAFVHSKQPLTANDTAKQVQALADEIYKKCHIWSRLLTMPQFEKKCMDLLTPSRRLDELNKWSSGAWQAAANSGKSGEQIEQLVASEQLQITNTASLSYVNNAVYGVYIQKILVEHRKKYKVDEKLYNKLCDLNHLPSRAELSATLRVRLPAPEIRVDHEPYTRQLQRKKIELTTTAALNGGSVHSMSLRDMLTIIAPTWTSFSPIAGFAMDVERAELLTKEFVESLATYLGKRCTSLSLSDKNSTILLFGQLNTVPQLTTFLGQTKKVPVEILGISLSDTDDYFASSNPARDVKAIEEYTKQYQPQIVVCCWMPAHTDYTAYWRHHNVLEYILIGERTTGHCGQAWATYGIDPCIIPEVSTLSALNT